MCSSILKKGTCAFSNNLVDFFIDMYRGDGAERWPPKRKVGCSNPSNDIPKL